MKLKKLFESLKRCKGHRKDYKIKWEVKFEVDDSNYIFSLLPTMVFVPWPYRYLRETIMDIMWLNCHITIGKWMSKEEE